MAISTTAAVLGAAAIGAGASAISSKKAADAQEDAANKAAKSSQYATDAATEEQRRQFDLAYRGSYPYRSAGEGAIGILSQLLGIDTYPYSPPNPYDPYAEPTSQPNALPQSGLYKNNATGQLTQIDDTSGYRVGDNGYLYPEKPNASTKMKSMITNQPEDQEYYVPYYPETPPGENDHPDCH